jgi:hypothetical protein
MGGQSTEECNSGSSLAVLRQEDTMRGGGGCAWPSRGKSSQGGNFDTAATDDF